MQPDLETTHINLTGFSNFTCVLKCRLPGALCWVGLSHLNFHKFLR